MKNFLMALFVAVLWIGAFLKFNLLMMNPVPGHYTFFQVFMIVVFLVPVFTAFCLALLFVLETIFGEY